MEIHRESVEDFLRWLQEDGSHVVCYRGRGRDAEGHPGIEQLYEQTLDELGWLIDSYIKQRSSASPDARRV